MTLKRLQIRNFQCHEDVRIKLDQKVTSIIGPSDCGKSAVIRSLRWIATNRPRGDGFIRQGTNEVFASVWLDKGKVKRSRDKENKYEVNGRDLKAIGMDVPETVFETLKIDELNFQGQHESPFWFDLTAGEVAKRLNSIVDLGLIDSTLSHLASSLRSVNSRLEVHQGELEDARQSVESLSYVEDLDDDLQRVEVLNQDVAEKAADASNLNRLVDQYADTHQWIRVHKSCLEVLEQLMSKGENAMELQEEAARLSDLIGLAEQWQDKANQPIPDIDELEEGYDRCHDLRMEHEQAEILIVTAVENQERLYEAKLKLENEEAELDEFVGDRCPMCGSEVEDVSCLM